MSNPNLSVIGGAPLSSPSFTGLPTAPTRPAGDATGSLATTSFVTSVINTVQSTIVGVNTQIDSYTATLIDAGKLIAIVSANATTLTIPANVTVAYPVGTVLSAANLSTGSITIAGAAGVTVNSPAGMRITLQFGQVAIVKIATDTWLLAGNTSV